MEQPFIEKTLGRVIEELAEKYEGKTAINYNDRDYKRSWREFNDECETIARAFMALGVK